MTLELSLEINRKLQAVLEDTLLKNIMLKVIGMHKVIKQNKYYRLTIIYFSHLLILFLFFFTQENINTLGNEIATMAGGKHKTKP